MTIEEFSGITTAPEDPTHAQQVVDHIAHLREDQINVITDVLLSWREAAAERERADRARSGDARRSRA
jgi:hypothetical protein